MEIFNDFFGNDVKKEIELLHFLYHQKRFVTIEEMSQALIWIGVRSTNITMS
ncbi:hypothetical protein ACH0F8_000244 [Enterococcus hirae]|uniref:hypothetical protein n=1 Tax=Enterococcus hirae TaxID=1354 RepID=UPI002543F75B|nr:hypothetical protein [Enterococcus hirae]MDK4468464.1 hypothetical protein [Enterococcus hirae]